jgi:hypothetical protein
MEPGYVEWTVKFGKIEIATLIACFGLLDRVEGLLATVPSRSPRCILLHWTQRNDAATRQMRRFTELWPHPDATHASSCCTLLLSLI